MQDVPFSSSKTLNRTHFCEASSVGGKRQISACIVLRMIDTIGRCMNRWESICKKRRNQMREWGGDLRLSKTQESLSASPPCTLGLLPQSNTKVKLNPSKMKALFFFFFFGGARLTNLFASAGSFGSSCQLPACLFKNGEMGKPPSSVLTVHSKKGCAQSFHFVVCFMFSGLIHPLSPPLK